MILPVLMHSPFKAAAVLVVFAGSASSLHAATRAEAADALAKNVLPVLEQRCFDCHDDDMKKGDISLEVLRTGDPAKHDIRLWDKVVGQLEAGTMPPKNKPPLEPQGKQAILDWAKLNVAATLNLPADDPGIHKTRRLTREEYNQTLRDLLGVRCKPADKFPADGSGGEGFANNADTLTLSPLLIEKYFAGAEEAVAEVWKNWELKAVIMKPIPGPGIPAEQSARMILEPFLPRAYRRPPTPEDVNALVTVFNTGLKNGMNWDGAVRLMIKAALTSPKFLFIHEGEKKDGISHPITDYELASRLSYFLWSSMPDDELFKLAAEGKLNNDATLDAQVRRMLENPKGEAFPRLFAGQWLRFEELFNSVDPDPRKFKEFNDALRHAMYDEAIHFSSHLLRYNGRILDFLDSDYTFLNEQLAKNYGIPNVVGPEMRKVALTDNRRGGLVGMGAILATTSYPQRTSPVLRGKWVLEQLLGAPPPPPPPNVGQLPEDDRDLKEMTLRQKLEAHRAKPVCAGCHVRMDPLGFGMENFNPIGQWRDQENGKSIDTSGELPGALKFNGPAELRKVLMLEKDKFVRTFCSRLLGFALSRGMEVCDQPTLLRLEETLKKNDYRSVPLIIAVVQSYPFRHRKD